MNYPISSAMASFCTTTSVRDAMLTIKEAGFDSLDFPISVYSRPLDSPLRKDDWREWVRSVREISDELQLPVTQAHASWEQAIPLDFSYEAPYEIYLRTMEACHMLGCRHLIFHPVLYLHRIENEATKDVIHEWNVRWFRELLPYAEKFDLIINLENTFDYRHVQRDGDPIFTYTNAADMLRLREGIGGDRVRICLDTGHANISGQNVPAMIRAYGSYLTTLHMNDNLGLITPVFEDLHYFPGYGKLDWHGIFTALLDVEYCGVVNIEPVSELKRHSRPIRLIQLSAAAQILRVYMSECPSPRK